MTQTRWVLSMLMAVTACAVWAAAAAPANAAFRAPATNYDPDNHTQNVYFAGPDGSLREMSWAQSRGWWRAPAVILPGGSLQAAASPPSAPPPATPAGQGSVSVTPAPAPVHRHSRLHVRIVIKWRYTRSHTRLVRIQMGRLPRRAVFSISCRGRGCPAHKLSATRAMLQHRHRTLRGPMYRAGDRLLLQLSAPSYAPERVRIVIRNRRAPAIDLL